MAKAVSGARYALIETGADFVSAKVVEVERITESRVVYSADTDAGWKWVPKSYALGIFPSKKLAQAAKSAASKVFKTASDTRSLLRVVRESDGYSKPLADK